MPVTIVNVEGFGEVVFPDGMSEEEIQGVIRRKFNEEPEAIAPKKAALLEEQQKLLSGETAERPDYTLGEGLQAGVYRGVKQLEQAGAGLGAMLVDQVAKPYPEVIEQLVRPVSDAWMRHAQKVGEEIQAVPPEVPSFSDIQSPGDAGTYAAENLAQLLPNIVATMIPGGMGAKLAQKGAQAAATGMAKEAAEKFITRQVVKGGAAGAAPVTIGIESGTIYSDIAEKTGQRAPGVALTAGVAAGSLDVVPALFALRRLFGPEVSQRITKGLLRRMGRAGAEQVLGEGLTEGAQTWIERRAVEFVDPEQKTMSAEGVDEIINSMIVGALGGAVMGGTVGAVEAYQNRGQTPPPLPDTPDVAAAKVALDEQRAAAQVLENAALPHVNEYVGRPIEADGSPIGVIVGHNKGGFVVQFKGQTATTDVPFNALGVQPGQDFRFEMAGQVPIIPPTPEQAAAASTPPKTSTPAEVEAKPQDNRETLAARILRKSGVNPDVANRFAQLVAPEITTESMEGLRDEVVRRFKDSGLVAEGQMYKYSTDPNYYRGEGFTPEEVAEHVTNAGIANEKLVAEARKKNDDLLFNLELGLQPGAPPATPVAEPTPPAPPTPTKPSGIPLPENQSANLHFDPEVTPPAPERPDATTIESPAPMDAGQPPADGGTVGPGDAGTPPTAGTPAPEEAPRPPKKVGLRPRAPAPVEKPEPISPPPAPPVAPETAPQLFKPEKFSLQNGRTQIEVESPYEVGGKQQQVFSVNGDRIPGFSSFAEKYPAAADEIRKRNAMPVAPETEQPEITPEVSSDRPEGTEGQPMEGPPPVDVREPAGPSPEPAPEEPTGGLPGPEVSTGAPSGGAVEEERPVRRRGLRNRPVPGPGTTGRTEPERQPPGPAPEPRTEESAPEPPRVEQPKTEADKNLVLPRDADWIPSGDKTKVRANLAAISLLKTLEAENRNPTPAEKESLAKYVGWGGLKQVFDEGKAAYRERKQYLYGVQEQEYNRWEKAWGNLYDEVKKALTTEEWDRAAQSILNAHYTSRTVINGVWDAVERMGFKGGVALEPSGGIGHFIGLQPESSRASTKWAAVELDDISGRILKKLYPEARVQVTGFEKARLPANSMDLVISNVPFAKDGPSDSRYPRFSLHNYFFARALDVVKPGGLVAFITSTSTMDNAASRAARDYMAERADLVGAIRLPNDAFKDNAGTEVTTDILFFRKRDSTPFDGQLFTRTAQSETYKGEPIEINEYFVAHPDMMLGRMSLEGTMYGGQEPALLPLAGASLADQLKAAVSKLPENAFGAQRLPGESVPEVGEGASGKIGALSFRDGKPVITQADGSFEAPDWAGTPSKVAQAKKYIGVRDATQKLIDTMLSQDGTDADIVAGRKELNRLYDDYVKNYGAVNGRKSAFLEDDNDFPLVLALEDGQTRAVESVTKKGKTITRRITDWVKSKIFSERTIFPREAPPRVDTSADGYQVSMNFRGRVDVDYIAQLTGQTVDAVKSQLQESGLAYENPESGQWEPAWKYLSGDVKGKLEAAKARVADAPQYQVNVTALEKVQPDPIPFEKISFKLGSTFIEPSIVQRFVREVLGLTDAEVRRFPETGHWHVDQGSSAGRREALNTTTYGAHGVTGGMMVDLALNLKSPVITMPEQRISETTGKPYTAEVKDPVATAAAVEKQRQVAAAFVDWVRKDNAAANSIFERYNETSNRSRRPTYDPPNWDYYPNASRDIKLRPHQMQVVTRILQESTMLAHAVGTGKTFVMITAAMEMRRLGLAKKPMIVVQNSTIEQFARSFKRLYPTARILVPSSKQRDAQNRNRTMARIATGDWDAVIVPQSFANMLPNDPNRERQYIRDQIAILKAAKIDAARESGGRSPRAADLQRAIKRLEKQLSEIIDRAQDDVLQFEQLGVDALFVDEAHEFKKLQFTTQMESIKGLDTGASQRGLAMFMKARWVQEKNQGRNVIFATGTPISNTITEMWTMMRFLRPDILERFGMEDFDSFAGNFAATKTELEQNQVGTWKDVTRFVRYTNGPELITAWRSVADVVTAEEANLPGLPAIEGGKVKPIVIERTPQVAAYTEVLRAELAAFEAMTGRAKRENSHIPLVVFTRAKKMTLDMRLIDSSLPDEPGSKLNVAADEIVKIYKESSDVKGTQLAFADLYKNPDGRFNLYQDLKKKLVARGIPEDEIIIIDDEIKEAKREAAFQKINDGEYRVALGSSARLGTGVNVQERLIGLHHLDAPARPMDIEQRNGRILRQGNQNPMVYIRSYGVKNTLDAVLFQRLSTKQKFVNQAMRGDIEGREFEDAANEISMSYDEQMAAFSGDPLTLEKVTLEHQIANLESLRDSHYAQVRKGRDTLEQLTTRGIPYKERELVAATEDAASAKETFSDPEKIQMRYGERTIIGKKEIAKFLEEKFSVALERAKQNATQLSKDADKGTKYEEPLPGFTFGGKQINLSVYAQGNPVWLDQQQTQSGWGASHWAIQWKFAGESDYQRREVTTGNGFFTSFDSYLRSVERRPGEVQAELDSRRREVLQLKSFVEQDFDRESELQEARAKYADVMSKISAGATGAAVAKAPQEVAPLGFEVSRYKPAEAQRTQIRRLLDIIQSKRPTKSDSDGQQGKLNLGIGLTEKNLPDGYKAGIVNALTERLREIETGMMQRQKPNDPQQFSVNLPGWETAGPMEQAMSIEEIREAIASEKNVSGLPMEIVQMPDRTDVAGWFFNAGDGSRIGLNASAIQSPEQARQTYREEQGHALLSTPEGKRFIEQFAQENMTDADREQLNFGLYQRRPDESESAHRLRMANEFIAKAGREKPGMWRRLIARVREWLAARGLATLSNEEVARSILRRLAAMARDGEILPGSLPDEALFYSFNPATSRTEAAERLASAPQMRQTDALWNAKAVYGHNDVLLRPVLDSFQNLPEAVQKALPTIQGRIEAMDEAQDQADAAGGAPQTMPQGTALQVAKALSPDEWDQHSFVTYAFYNALNLIEEQKQHASETAKAIAEAKSAVAAERKRLPRERLEALAGTLIDFRRGTLTVEAAAARKSGDQTALDAANTALADWNDNVRSAVSNVLQAMVKAIPATFTGGTSADVLSAWQASKPANVGATSEIIAAVEQTLADMPDVWDRFQGIRNPELSDDVKALAQRAAAMRSASEWFDNFVRSPEFQENYTQTIDALPASAVVLKEDKLGNPVFQHPTDPKVEIALRRDFTKEGYKHDRDALDTAEGWYLDYVDEAKTPNQEPLKVIGYLKLINHIRENLRNQLWNPETGKPIAGALNLFDVVARRIPGAQIIDYLVQNPGGQIASWASWSAANYAEFLRASQIAHNRQSIKTSAPSRKAFEAAGMDVDTWTRHVSDEILAGYQTFGALRLKVGDMVRGHKITAADMESIRAQHKYVNLQRETAKDVLKFPTAAGQTLMIRDVVGTMTIEREAQPVSEFTMPRRLAGNTLQFINDWMRVHQESPRTKAEKFDLFERMLDGTYSQHLEGHIRSIRKNPEYAADVKSPFKADYLQLALEQDMHPSGRMAVSTVSGLVDHLFSKQRNLPPDQQMPKADIRDQVLGEIDGAVRRFADEQETYRLADPDRTTIDVTSAENFMNRPRGRALLPESAYTYSVVTEDQQATIRSHIGEIFAQRFINQLHGLVSALDAQIRSQAGLIDQGKLDPADTRAQQLVGENFLNHTEAIKLRSALKPLLDEFQAFVNQGRAYDFWLLQPLSMGRAFLSNSLLQQPRTMLQNLTGPAVKMATLQTTMLRSGHNVVLRAPFVGGLWFGGKEIVQHGGRIVNNLAGIILNQPEVTPYAQKLHDFLQAHKTGLFAPLAGLFDYYMMRQQARMAALKDIGIHDEDPVRQNLQGLIDLAQYGGRLRGGKMTRTKRAFGIAKTAILLANEIGLPFQLPRSMSVAGVEALNNGVADYMLREILSQLFINSKAALDSRASLKYDPTTTILTPAEVFGNKHARAADLAQLRQFFDREGINLDRLLIEFWQSRQDLSRPSQTLQEYLTPDKYRGLLRQMAQYVNKGAFHNRPFYKNPIARTFGMFLSYMLNDNAQIARALSNYSRDNRNALLKGADHFVTIAALLAIFSVIGQLYQPLWQYIHKLLFKEESPVPPIWKARSAKELMAINLHNLAGPMPILGRLFVNLIGTGQPGTRWSFGYGLSFFPISFAQNLISAFSKARQTGDWDRMLVELMRQYVPNSKWALNRLPMREGITTETAVRNILAANAPIGVDLRQSGGFPSGQIQYSPARAYTDDIVNALSSETVDMDFVRRQREAGIQALIDSGKSPQDAAEAFDRSVMARNPFVAVYGRDLTQAEMIDLRQSLAPDELERLDRLIEGRQAYAREFGRTVPDYMRDVGGRGGGGRTPLFRPFGLRRRGVAGVGRASNPMAASNRITGAIPGMATVRLAGLRAPRRARRSIGGVRRRGIRGLRARRSRLASLRRRRRGFRNSRRIRLRRV